MQRPPDFIIGDKSNPYLKRWWLIPRNKIFNIYLHEILHSDDDRALHDHPWINMSVILEGRYIEHKINAGGVHVSKTHTKGSIILRRSVTSHRLEILPGETCWTLFITGPVIRTWGFHCRKKWVPWEEFVDVNDKGKTGKGCGEYD